MKLMRYARPASAARAMDELLKLSVRAESLGVSKWIDLYVPRTELPAREMYRAMFNFKAALDTLEADKRQQEYRDNGY